MEGRTPHDARATARARRPSLHEAPHSYTETFFVPKSARWPHIRDELHTDVANGLNKALGALEEWNEPLEGVVAHIDFNRQVGRTRLSDAKLRELIQHFSRYRLRNEDFEFPNLLGAAYEYLIGQFADSAGKKGGEFYTPRDVVRLMVQILKPQQGMRIYDPCVGSGGMLILSREYVAEHGGDVNDLRLYGQDNRPWGSESSPPSSSLRSSVGSHDQSQPRLGTIPEAKALDVRGILGGETLLTPDAAGSARTPSTDCIGR